jgi:flagellar FliL protein
MSEKKKEEAGEEKEPKAKGKMPMTLLIIIVLVLNVLIVGKVFFGGGGGKGGGKEKEKPKEEMGAKVTLEEFLLNMTDGEHYLKATIALGFKKGVDEKKIEEETAPIRDAIVGVLSTKSREEVASAKGKEELKKEILEELNKEMGEGFVLKVYFTNFATQ